MNLTQKEAREKNTLEKHSKLSKLFRTDRLAFERERKKMIEDLINGEPDEGRRKTLREMQNRWDERMKNAGSPHNRFVLAQTFFWDHVDKKLLPLLQKF